MIDDSLLDVNSSYSGNKWSLRSTDEELISSIQKDNQIDYITARIIAGRKISLADVQDFLNPSLRKLLPDPSSMQDMDKAAKIIFNAIKSNKKITIFADYDVDGATSAAQLVKWARNFNNELKIYVPDRIKEGYGPSIEAFEHLKKNGTELVVTVDCGAAAHSALVAAQALDLSIIVIDHHLMDDDMPPAEALVNPNRIDDSSKLNYLAAAGVTFMLLVALNREARVQNYKNIPDLFDYLDLAALGTICDVVPLKGLNRAIVKQGLKVLSRESNIGLKSLMFETNTKSPITPYHCGFVLGPRINAGGRIGKANIGAELLSTENPQLAIKHAQELDRVNIERRIIQDKILDEALLKAFSVNKTNSIIVVGMEGWHPGVIGIVAGRLKDRFNKPVIVIGTDENGIGKGSGRSIQGVDLGNEIKKLNETGLLISGGGHEMACGLTIENKYIKTFHETLERNLSDKVNSIRSKFSTKIDALLNISAVNKDLINSINQIGPYGSGNPTPTFAFAELRVAYADRVKGGHIRCNFEDKNGQRIKGICFRAEEMGFDEILLNERNRYLHIVGTLKKNTWNGRTTIDLQVIDVSNC
ncbi:MAG: single-stranded-DNA-specific exonuclease RecJ [Hellea sp.]|nr:single-stranded-DNA-specific exonuclease RecJ [Hellea sp.]MDG2360768.1 single-stranded-DNA-specific exonuclease RecJ [Hellea sp.]